jgi:Tfp pilus assembly protein FimT
MTLIELVLAMVVAGLITMIAIPRAATVIDVTNVGGARKMVAELVGKTRFEAIMRGGPAQLTINPDGRLWVTAPKVGVPGAEDTVGTIEHLDGRFGVAVTAPTSQTQIGFDAQGVGTAPGNTIVVLRRGSKVDTLTISASGRTTP